VTLGGRGWWRDEKGSRRHPTVGDRVVLGVGATVLGPVHIGAGARIGAHALVCHDVPSSDDVDRLVGAVADIAADLAADAG
jgi:serine O-acetyltransferase